MAGTVLLVNHVQSGYLDPNNPDDVALRKQIYDYVDRMRPHVDHVVWSYATGTTPLGISFDMARERPHAFREGDLEVENNNGKGDDPKFIRQFFDLRPEKTILVGVFFEACSNRTAQTLKQNFMKMEVAVPMDITNKPDAEIAAFYRQVESDLRSMGIDVDSTSEELLSDLSGKPRLRTSNQATLLANPQLEQIEETQMTSTEETTGLTKHGVDLDHFRELQERFLHYASGSEPEVTSPASRLSPELFAEVTQFCDTLRQSMSQHFDGNRAAVGTFSQAMQIRSRLLSDPRTAQNGEVRDLLRHIVAQDERGRPERSLSLTAQVHGDALDPVYSGEPKKEVDTHIPGAMPLFEA